MVKKGYSPVAGVNTNNFVYLFTIVMLTLFHPGKLVICFHPGMLCWFQHISVLFRTGKQIWHNLVDKWAGTPGPKDDNREEEGGVSYLNIQFQFLTDAVRNRTLE